MDRRRLVAGRIQGRRRRVDLDQRVLHSPDRDRDRQDHDAHPAPAGSQVRAGLRDRSPVVERRQGDLLRHRRDSEFRRLVRLDLLSGQVHSLTGHIPWDVEDYDVCDDGPLVAAVVNAGGISKIWTNQDDPTRQVPEFPQGVVSGLKFRPRSRDIGFTLSASDAATDAYSMNVLGTPDAVPGMFSSDSPDDANAYRRPGAGRRARPEASTREFVKPVLIEYPSFDGRKIPAFVYRPSAPNSRARGPC